MKMKLNLQFVVIFAICIVTMTVKAQWVVHDISSITTNSSGPVYFSDTLNGWIGSNNGTIIHTSDGGLNWTLENSGVTSYISDIFFIDSLNGWAVTNSGQVLKTSNSGINWINQYLSGNLIFIQFFDTLFGLTGNRDGIMFKTNDGGQNWTPMSDTLQPSTLHDIFALDSTHIWGVGNTCIYKYNGTTWTQIYYNGNHDMYSVYFLDSLNGWTVGANGLILFTIDGGTNWNTQSTGWISGYFFSVFFSDSTNGWTVGDNGKVYKYDGINWINQNSNISQMLSSVYFVNNGFGWATSWGGKLIHTNIPTYLDFHNRNDNILYSIFPNPLFNETTINTKYSLNNADLALFNSYGQPVEQINNISGQSVTINCNNLPSGLYFIRLKENNKLIAFDKIIIIN